MIRITFITGNQKKADYLARYLGHPVDHVKLDLDELQSLDLKEIVEHKVKQAYEKVGKPVIVVAETPSGENGYGWDRIFIPEGYEVTRASLSEEDDQKTYMQIKPFAKLKDFLSSNN